MLEAVHAAQRVVDGRVDEEVPRRVAPIPIRRRDVAQPACAQHVEQLAESCGCPAAPRASFFAEANAPCWLVQIHGPGKRPVTTLASRAHHPYPP